MSTPIRNQYLRLKAQFPGAIMFFRLGDFYEMFDEDARTGSRELELTLTSREFARGERSPMCGVPYHAAHGGALAPGKLARRQRQLQLARSGERIVVEHLVEVAEAKEHDRAGELGLEAQVLVADGCAHGW